MERKPKLFDTVYIYSATSELKSSQIYKLLFGGIRNQFMYTKTSKELIEILGRMMFCLYNLDITNFQV